jgi:hypothetical protein
MSEDLGANDTPVNNEDNKLHNVISLDGLYENWFLDYASYVILRPCRSAYSRWVKACTAPYPALAEGDGRRAF